MAADAADSNEEILQTGGISGGGEKRGEGGDLGAFIGGRDLEEGVGYRAGEARWTAGREAMREEGSVPS
jgi:hypothetical protein